MWLHHPHFLPLVKQWWVNAPFVLVLRMHQFACKPKHVKAQIKNWNQHVFKNVFKKKELVKLQLEKIYNNIIQQGMNNDTYVKQKCLQQEWEELCS